MEGRARAEAWEGEEQGVSLLGRKKSGWLESEACERVIGDQEDFKSWLSKKKE